MDVSLTTRSIAAVELNVSVDGGGCSLSAEIQESSDSGTLRDSA